MRQQTCVKCGNSFPLNETVYIYGDLYCHPCGDERLESVEEDQITEGDIYPMTDPTICTRCNADNGQLEYEMFLEMPICDRCKDFVQNHPFPIWIKAAAVGLLIIVAFSLVSNFRFFKARILMDSSLKNAFQQGDMELAAEQMSKAAALVPASKDMQIMANYMIGVRAVQTEDYEKAIENLSKCSALPPEYDVNIIILNAKIGLAFDNKEYNEFLDLTQKYKDFHPDNPIVVAQMASAYACLYAANGKEGDKQNAMSYLEQAEKLCEDEVNPYFVDYKERILYRIETRKILKKNEYYEITGKTPPEAKI